MIEMNTMEEEVPIKKYYRGRLLIKNIYIHRKGIFGSYFQKSFSIFKSKKEKTGNMLDN